MRRLYVIPLLLLTTLILSLSDVFPISVEQTDAEPKNEKEYDVWRNYLIQLDRQQKNSYEFPDFENIPTDYDNYGKRTSGNQHIIIKIRKICLALLTNSKKNIKRNINDYWNSIQRDPIDLNKLYAERDDEDQKLLTNKLNSILNTKKARGAKLRKKNLSYSEIVPEVKKMVKKRFFSELSRLKGFSITDNEINNRMHLYQSDSTRTTMESWVRSLGGPLRWG